MAMVVEHNVAAQLALGELNRNSDKLRKSLEKVSSGQKVVGAKSDASAYAISEKMREQIRTLAQNNRNVQNGAALFKTADGGINNIVEELRNLKELAINSANDTNTDVDRMTIQKEFKQKMANINDIATTTNYNRKTLLDGTYEQRERTVREYRWVTKQIEIELPPGSTPDPTPTTDPDPTPTPTPSPPGYDEDNVVHSGVVEPTGPVTRIRAGDYTINSDGVYELYGYTGGTITL